MDNVTLAPPKRYPFLPPDREMAWFPYLWLVYLIQIWAYPFFAHPPLWQWFAIAGVTAVFLPLYFWGWWLRGHAVLGIIAAMFVLGTVCASWNPCACMFLVYGVSFVSRVGDQRANIRTWLGLLAVIGLEAWIFRLSAIYWVPGLLASAFLGIMVIYKAEQSRTYKRLEMAQSEVTRIAQIAERERIARDLHDLLGHTLSVIVLKSELAAKLGEQDMTRALQEMRDVERISREALTEVRQAVRGYRAAGVAAEVERAREMLELAGIRLDCVVDRLSLLPASENALAFAIREAVTNIVRHSGARVCRMHLQQATDAVRLEIADDGRGGAITEGCGLTGMRERLEAVGGTLQHDGLRGLRVVIQLPLVSTAISGAA